MLDQRIPISYNYRGECNRFYLTATFADRETRESVIGHIMYLPSLEQALRKLLSAVAVGGLVSVLTKNHANLALRAAMLQDWSAVVDAFDSRRYTNRLGIEHARADEPEEVIRALRNLGADLDAWYGVRLFTDHWGDVEPPENFEVILQAEQLAGERDPYRQLCSATHVLARREG